MTLRLRYSADTPFCVKLAASAASTHIALSVVGLILLSVIRGAGACEGCQAGAGQPAVALLVVAAIMLGVGLSAATWAMVSAPRVGSWGRVGWLALVAFEVLAAASSLIGGLSYAVVLPLGVLAALLQPRTVRWALLGCPVRAAETQPSVVADPDQ